MEPQSLPTPGYTPYQPPGMSRSSGGGGKAVMWIIVVIVVAALAAGGVWFWQQQNVSSLSSANADLTKQLSSAKDQQAAASDDSQTTSFGESKVPFTFNYPSSWVLSSDAPILYDKDMPVSYSIALAAPSSVNTQTPANGSAVTNGALINIAVLPAPSTDVKALVPKAPNSATATPTTDVIVSGVPGVQYQFGDTSYVRMYTDIIKEKVRYSITFEAKGDLKSNDHYAAYDALVKSFKLK